MYVQNNSKKLTITGLAETQGENCFHEVSNFLKNVMKIDTQIPLKMALRIGNGENRMMLIKLKYFEHKSLIFQKFDRLKTINKSRQTPYYISEQLPEVWAERRRFVQHLKYHNSKLPSSQQHNIAVKKNQLEIDGEEYKAPMTPPTLT